MTMQLDLVLDELAEQEREEFIMVCGLVNVFSETLLINKSIARKSKTMTRTT
jgi:hypothetical protein